MEDSTVIEQLAHHLPRGASRLTASLLVVVVLSLALLGGLGRLPLGGRPLVAAIAVAAVLYLVATRIQSGIVLLPVVAVAVPFGIGTGTQSELVAALLLAGFLFLLWIVQLVISQKIVVVKSPINVPLLGFLITTVLSTIASYVIRDPLVLYHPRLIPAQLGGLGTIVISLCTTLVVMNCLADTTWIRRLASVFLALGAATLLFYSVSSGRDLPGASIGGLFSLWVIALAFGQALFNEDMPRLGRASLLILSLAWFSRRFFLEGAWLSGWLPAVVALLTVALLRSRAAFLTVLIVGAAAAWGNSQYVTQLFETQVEGEDSGGNFLRSELWQQGLAAARENPLLGAGPAGNTPYNMTYLPDRALSTHSNYVDIVLQTGLIGSFFFLWLLVATFHISVAVRRQWRHGFEAGFANGMLGGLVGMVVAMALGDWVLPFVYNQGIAGFRYTVHSWVLLGALASMQRLSAK